MADTRPSRLFPRGPEAREAATEPLILAPPARRRPPWTLVVGSALIAAALLLPIVFLLLQAAQAGWADVYRLLFRRLTRVLIVNTVQLAVLVCTASAVIGTGAAFLLERTDLPGRQVWAVLVVLPVAIPDFVVGYAWHSIAPGRPGSGRRHPGHDARPLPAGVHPGRGGLAAGRPYRGGGGPQPGSGPGGHLRAGHPAPDPTGADGGCLVVCLALLAEFGAFEIVHFQTFTTTIFAELERRRPGRGVGSVHRAGAHRAGGPGRRGRSQYPGPAQPGDRPGRPASGVGAGCEAGSGLAALGALSALVGAGLGRPDRHAGVLDDGQPRHHAARGVAVGGPAHTAAYSAAAALVATALALPVALLAVRFRSPASVVLERSTFLVQSLPGLVIALALVYFGVHYAQRFYQTAPMLVAAYAILFFPLALICVRASVAQAPRRLEEVARSLGSRPGSCCCGSRCPWSGRAWPPAFAWCSSRPSPS